MSKESGIRMNEVISEPEDNHLTPRCSTPIFDSCVAPGKPSSQISREKNDVRSYREWKLRLQRGKPRLFKVRGNRSRTATTDCSIISGHFESEVDDGGATATPGPTPVYQMWFPFGYPGFWTPAHACQHQNQIWSYGTAQIPHYQIPSTFFGPAEWFFANFCQRTGGYQPVQLMQCNANYPANSYPHIHWPQSHYQIHHNHPFPTYSATPNYPHFLNRGTVIS